MTTATEENYIHFRTRQLFRLHQKSVCTSITRFKDHNCSRNSQIRNKYLISNESFQMECLWFSTNYSLHYNPKKEVIISSRHSIFWVNVQQGEKVTHQLGRKIHRKSLWKMEKMFMEKVNEKEKSLRNSEKIPWKRSLKKFTCTAATLNIKLRYSTSTQLRIDSVCLIFASIFSCNPTFITTNMKIIAYLIISHLAVVINCNSLLNVNSIL